MDELLAVKLEVCALEEAKASRDLDLEGDTVNATMRW